MKILTITSKKHGTFEVLLDNEDYEKVTTLGRTPKWCVRKQTGRNNLIYFQKRMSDNSLIEMHRFIMGFPKGKYVDHINGNTLDNRKRNLRVCTNAANLRNGRVRSNNKSGVKGVYWDKARNKWGAKIKVDYIDIALGRYKKFEDAVRARREAELIYWE